MILIFMKNLENRRVGLTSYKARLITFLLPNNKLLLDFWMLQLKALELIILVNIYRRMMMNAGREDANVAARHTAG